VARAGRPKGDKRDRTRPQLLEAARALIREKGYEHTTLDAIAERAGMTTGAIYGNFKNRDELFISLRQTYWAPIKPHVQRNSTFPEIMRALADATLAAIPDRSTAAVGRLTGLAYTLTHEELRAKVAAFLPKVMRSASNGFAPSRNKKISPCLQTNSCASYTP
jgi:AcrR family transcriptional regulator